MSQRNMNKTMSKRRGKTKDDKNKNQFDKRRKDNKTLSQKKKAKRGGKKTTSNKFYLQKEKRKFKKTTVCVNIFNKQQKMDSNPIYFDK
jgi:DNA topoisomerase VI subunit A